MLSSVKQFTDRQRNQNVDFPATTRQKGAGDLAVLPNHRRLVQSLQSLQSPLPHLLVTIFAWQRIGHAAAHWACCCGGWLTLGPMAAGAGALLAVEHAALHRVEGRPQATFHIFQTLRATTGAAQRHVQGSRDTTLGGMMASSLRTPQAAPRSRSAALQRPPRAARRAAPGRSTLVVAAAGRPGRGDEELFAPMRAYQAEVAAFGKASSEASFTMMEECRRFLVMFNIVAPLARFGFPAVVTAVEAAAALAVIFAKYAAEHEATAEAALADAAKQPATAAEEAAEARMRAAAAWRLVFDALSAARRAQPKLAAVMEAEVAVQNFLRLKHQRPGMG